MLNKYIVSLSFLLIVLFAEAGNISTLFDSCYALPKKMVFHDTMHKNWKKNWFIDGEKATLTNTALGLEFCAGSEAGNDAHHAVLWTKRSFDGDLLIEYDYTRLDTGYMFVNIIYIQATGSGANPYCKDIYKWRALRKKPAMSMYFNTMNTYHISYAAGSTDPQIVENYVRARRYMPLAGKGLNQTALTPDYNEVDIFKPKVKYHITIIKHSKTLIMRVEGENKRRQYVFDTSKFPAITEGRIGLRHMYTRASRYENFKIYKFQHQ